MNFNLAKLVVYEVVVVY